MYSVTGNPDMSKKNYKVKMTDLDLNEKKNHMLKLPRFMLGKTLSMNLWQKRNLCYFWCYTSNFKITAIMYKCLVKMGGRHEQMKNAVSELKTWLKEFRSRHDQAEESVYWGHLKCSQKSKRKKNEKK